jgi:hypothetical protein
MRRNKIAVGFFQREKMRFLPEFLQKAGYIVLKLCINTSEGITDFRNWLNKKGLISGMINKNPFGTGLIP